MKIPKRKLFLLIIFAYVAFSLYAAYNVFFSTKVISRVHRVVKKETGAPSGNFTLPTAVIKPLMEMSGIKFPQFYS